ncbi:MAG: PH domain-containing protein [Candidatus Limnocylindria bacterium]
MSYARNLLSRGEEVVYESRQHWFAVIERTWVWILVALVALALVIWLNANDQLVSETIDGIVTIVALVGLLASLVWIGIVLWDWRNQEWLVTTRRVVRAEGILNKAMVESSLEKINDARLTQSWVGRIFGYGTLDILTAAEEIGGASVADFPMLADPVDFKKAMLNQKELVERPELAPQRYQRAGPPPEMQRADAMPPRAGSDRVAEVRADAGLAAPAGPASTDAASAGPSRERSAADEMAETLERLAGLRDKGLITAEEYEAKKRELLERM